MGRAPLEAFEASRLASWELGFVTPCSKPCCGSQIPWPSCKAEVLSGATKAVMTCAVWASLTSPGAAPQPPEITPCCLHLQAFTMLFPLLSHPPLPCPAPSLLLSLSFLPLGCLLHG